MSTFNLTPRCQHGILTTHYCDECAAEFHVREQKERVFEASRRAGVVQGPPPAGEEVIYANESGELVFYQGSKIIARYSGRPLLVLNMAIAKALGEGA